MKTLYQQRFYRSLCAPADLACFEVKIRESDLLVFAEHDLHVHAYVALAEARRQVERYIERDGQFARALSPHAADVHAPGIVREMSRAGAEWGVGPMASVAGAIAQQVGRALLPESDSVIVENGGDIFLALRRPARLRLYAGEESPFSGRVLFEVPAFPNGLGICTSSGRVGHSLSLGCADAVVAVAQNAAFADAGATAIANRVHSPEDVAAVVDEVSKEGMLRAVIIAAGDRIGFWGDIQITGKEY